MRHRARHVIALLLAALLAAGPCHVAAQSALADLLTRAATMSDAGQHAEAYALLAAEEDTHIGEIAYDYALGRAALHAGRPDRATIAFARVLALDPGHAGALIDSGRAYLALGNRAQAEAAFEALLALDPPPAIRAQLLIYLGQARGAERTAGAAVRGYLTVSAGTSSNVNQAPAQGPVFVPGLPFVVQLADQNVRKEDSFASLGGGVEAAMVLRDRLSLIGSAEFLSRANAHESDFDTGGLAGSLGLAWSGERYLLRGQVQLMRNTLGGDTSRDVKALSLDISETTSPRPGSFGVLFGFLHLGSYRHPPEDLKIYDADFVSAGAGMTTRLDEKSTVSVALVTGLDEDKGGNPSGDRQGIGGRVAWEQILTPSFRLAAVASLVRSRYNALDAIFLTEREDTRLDFEAFLRYQIAPKLEARLGAWRSEQDSNIPIYEYERTDWWVSISRLFD
jgi:tetratricopeptide (TPR) repeat protein